MKNILVIGGAGFIGFNLCNKLLEDPNNFVSIIDNLITGQKSNINKILEHPRCDFFNCDITNKEKLEMFFSISTINEIYHLASIASPPKYLKYPIETLDTNIIGTKNILELIKDTETKLLFASTSEIYGEPLIHPQTENYYGNVNTVGLRSCYDESKRCAETYIYTYRNLYKKDYKIVRIFNTYGPAMDINDGRVITNFIKNILSDEPVEINGDGMQTRSFCYVDDLVNGLISMMESKESGPINLGNPNTEVNMFQLKSIFEDIIHRKIDFITKPLMENDPKIRKPDISLAQKKLNFNPQINLKEGISKTLEYFVYD